jgi:hypothetical protein
MSISCRPRACHPRSENRHLPRFPSPSLATPTFLSLARGERLACSHDRRRTRLEFARVSPSQTRAPFRRGWWVGARRARAGKGETDDVRKKRKRAGGQTGERGGQKRKTGGRAPSLASLPSEATYVVKTHRRYTLCSFVLLDQIPHPDRIPLFLPTSQSGAHVKSHQLLLGIEGRERVVVVGTSKAGRKDVNIKSTTGVIV